MAATQRYAFTHDVSGDVVGLWSGFTEDVPPQPTDPNLTLVETTLAIHTQLKSGGLNFRNSPQRRWNWNGAAISQNTDARNRVRFIPTTIDVEQGAVGVTVQMEVITDGGAVRTGVNIADFHAVILGRPVNIDIAAGVATLNIDTSEIHEDVVDSTPDYRVEAPLSIRIATNNTIVKRR